tara:strand:- start:2765 stop:3481 length:717 start_codon:yes stop_codon:yes gene_type:complete
MNLIDILNEVKNSVKYDLQKEFDMANKKYFDGKLKPVELKWRSLRNEMGVVRATSLRSTGVYTVRDLTINNKYVLTDELFYETLLHEMCHLLMLQNQHDYTWVGGYHGREWNALATDIGQKSGYDLITVTEMGDLKSSNTKPTKKTIIGIFKFGNGLFISRMLESVYLKKYSERGIMDRYNASVVGIVLTSTHPMLNKFKLSRTGNMKRTDFSPISIEDADELVKSAVSIVENRNWKL